jgi:hypothetical protein
LRQCILGAGGREDEDEDDGYVLVLIHGTPFGFHRRTAPERREFDLKRKNTRGALGALRHNPQILSRG